ncbi:hypothetical protein NA57DRAFT_82036 [Rhizodiscina lignyota]|uniref:Uncharacterized protein n=1 Tax=Rhizodiscina lignyota TaxID=1504668 RepID=A0A9P4I4Q2_9PEZI|nr:hypothetical protein NA57DRAFT_82036 [Rhizodiscina lignyota]
MSCRSSPRSSQIFDPDFILRIKTPGSNEIFCTGKGRSKARCSSTLNGTTREEVLATLQKMSTMRPGRATQLLPELARLTLHCDNHKSQVDERVREWTKFLHRAESVIANGSTCSFPDFKDVENKHLRLALWELEVVKRELQENKDRAKRQARALRSLAQMHIESQQQLAGQLQRAMTLDRELAASRAERMKLAVKLERQERVYVALKAHHSELQAAFNDTDEIHEQILQKLRSETPDAAVQVIEPSVPDTNPQSVPPMMSRTTIQSLALSVHRQLEESQAYWQRTEAALKERLSVLEERVSESLQEAAEAKEREVVLLRDLALAKEQQEMNEEGQRRVQSQLEKFQAQLEECQTQLHEHQSQLEERQRQLQECQSQLEECQNKFQVQQIQLEERQSKLQECQSRLEESRTQFQAQQAQLQHSQEKAQKLQGTLEDTQNRETKLSVDLGQAQSDLDKAAEKLKSMEVQQEDRNDYHRLSERLRTADALEASKLKHRISMLEGQLNETVDYKIRGWVARFKERMQYGHQRHYGDRKSRRRTWEW